MIAYKDNGWAIPLFCDKCGNKYKKGDVSIVQSNPNKTVVLVHIKCSSCGAEYIIGVSKRNAFKDVINTDLQPGAYEKVRAVISADDVLDVYEFFSKRSPTVMSLTDDIGKLFVIKSDVITTKVVKNS